MIITIDMVNGDITEERTTDTSSQREHVAADTYYPQLDVGLQVFEPTQEKQPAIPDHLAELDADTFISQMND